MSNSILELQQVAVLDPIVDGTNSPVSGILIGGTDFTSAIFRANNASNSSINIKIDPPSPYVYVDRRILLEVPIVLSITGMAEPGTRLLQSKYDAPRAYPIMGSLSNLNVQINNTQYNTNPQHYIKELTRFDTGKFVSDRDYSTTASMLDNCQEYSDLLNTNRSPLAIWGDNPYETPRGGAFEYTTIVNPLNVEEVPTELTATVAFTAIEPLFISPLIPTLEKTQGFFDVQTMNVMCTFVSDLRNTMWSHDGTSANTITNIDVELGVAITHVFHITPKQIAAKPYTGTVYQVSDINVRPVSTSAAIAPNASVSIDSGSYTLNSVPNRMYIFVKEQTQDRCYTKTDSYFRLNSISMQFSNKSGILGNATSAQLYSISARNGYIGSYQDWNGSIRHQTVGAVEKCIPGVGSVLCVEFGTDIGLPSHLAPGVGDKFQVLFRVNVTNVNQTRSITPELFTITVSDHTMNIINTTATTQTSIITTGDALKALNPDFPTIPYNLYRREIFGGSWEKLKKTFGNIWKVIKGVLPDVLSSVVPGLGIPAKALMESAEGMYEQIHPKAVAAKATPPPRPPRPSIKKAPKPPPKPKAKGGAIVAGRLRLPGRRPRLPRGGRLIYNSDYSKYRR